MNTDKYYLLKQSFNYPSFKIKRENPVLYREQKDDYNRRLSELTELFKNDLLNDVGLEEHPFRDKIFAYAWSEWHSGGYSEIASHMTELAELIKCFNINDCVSKLKVENAFMQLAFQELNACGCIGLDTPEGQGIVREKALEQMRELNL